jgi:hypothetical protein
METNSQLFEIALCPCPSRVHAVKSANDRHTDYCLHSSDLKKNKNYFVITVISNQIQPQLFHARNFYIGIRHKIFEISQIPH